MKSELNLFNAPLDAVVAQLRFRVAAHARPGFALLDFPHYANVGDSAIWIGTLTLLQAITGRDPAYVSGQHDLDDEALRAALPEGPIFLAGGGNFGDLWNHHQNFREGVIARFRDRPVVQLPQSIHYTDPARIARTARIIASHPDFTLLVRDEASRDLALRHFDCPVELCADAALAIGPIAPAPARVDVLALLRTDKEGAGMPPLPAGIPVEDWVDEDRLAVRRARLAATLRAWSALAPASARARACEAAARHRLARGLRQIAQGRAIVTDRLHVHILALLLGRPHAVLDNVYGKIGGFLDAFTGTSPLVYRAADLDDALAWAKAAARKRKAA